MRAVAAHYHFGLLPCLLLCPCSDQHDIMACCKGDYGLYYRSMAGWLRGGAAERAVLTAADLAAPSTRRLSVWPFDRWAGRGARRQHCGGTTLAVFPSPSAASSRSLSLIIRCRSESRGNLMAVSIRRSEDEVLMIGFRSTSHWEVRHGASASWCWCCTCPWCLPLTQPLPLTAQGWRRGKFCLICLSNTLLSSLPSCPQDVSSVRGRRTPEGSRHNVRGLSVELVRRDPATGLWADHRGALDFNRLTGDWPDALPAQEGGFPRQAAVGRWKGRTMGRPACLPLACLRLALPPALPAC
jgi:hypothetical protein